MPIRPRKIESSVSEALMGVAPIGHRTSATEMIAIRGGVKWMVLARDSDQFARWVKFRNLHLQDCKYIYTEEQMKGFDFSSPARELMMLKGWEDKRSHEFVEAGFVLRSRYCLQRRVSSVSAEVEGWDK